MAALDETKSVYGFAIHALLGRQGTVPKKWFDVISGSPKRLKGHLSSNRVLADLQRLEMIDIVSVPAIGECVRLTGFPLETDVSFARLKATLVTDRFFLTAIEDWLKKLGLVSYHKVDLRADDGSPTFGHFGWDLTAPSYIHPMVCYRAGAKALPGFVVVDIALHSHLGDKQIGYFVNKCDILRNQKRTRPFMSLLVAQGFTEEAYRIGKTRGMIFTTPELLFGKDVAEGLRTLTKTLENAARYAVKTPEVIPTLFSKLGRIEGASGNLRGALFELIVGHCVKEKDGGYIDIGVEIKDPQSGEFAEIDVLRVKQNQEVCIYECRGHAPDVTVDDKTIEHWIEHRIPRIRRWILNQSHYSKCKLSFEFWTTGTLTPEASAHLRNASTKTRKYTIAWKTGQEVYEYVQAVGSKRLMHVMKEQYLKHPLSQLNDFSDRTAEVYSARAHP
ncbi:MAG: hypothetical protein RBS80_10390 [Thermoguttaceae bacterium]|nr:hypothetical protein [Thermoguttaceae bacterium]